MCLCVCVCVFFFFFWEKRLSEKSNNVIVFPFAFCIAVQHTFKPLWSHLLLQNHESCDISFALCFKSQLISLLPASEEFVLEFPSHMHLSSSGSYPLHLSDLGDLTGSNATAQLCKDL